MSYYFSFKDFTSKIYTAGVTRRFSEKLQTYYINNGSTRQFTSPLDTTFDKDSEISTRNKHRADICDSMVLRVFVESLCMLTMTFI